MFGLLLAAALGALKLVTGRPLLESVFIESAGFLFWWYVVAGAAVVGLAALAWAGDLGTEGARLRHGVASALSWMVGLPRIALVRLPLLFLTVRRVLLGTGAYLLTRGLRAVGATFVRDETLLVAGFLTLGAGLVSALLIPVLRRRFSPTRLQPAAESSAGQPL